MTGSGLRLCRCENLVNLMYEVWWWKHDIFKMKISSNFSLWQKKHEIIFLFVCLFVCCGFVYYLFPASYSFYLFVVIFVFRLFVLAVFSSCFLVLLSACRSSDSAPAGSPRLCLDSPSEHDAPPAASKRRRCIRIWRLFVGCNLRRRAVNLNTSRQISLWSEAFSHILAAEPRNVSNDPVIIR